MTLPPSRLSTFFHAHLVSDSTGDTLATIARAVTARFDALIPIEHAYPLVRSTRQLERVLKEIEDAPGIVIHTLYERELRGMLEAGCRELDVMCVAALDPFTSALGRYLGATQTSRLGAQHTLDADYFHRIETLDYAISHDDGHGGRDLAKADVVLVGVSRTSKTPTCIYLAHRGVRAANVPLVPGADPPAKLMELDRTANGPLVVGLVVSPERLLQVRKNRLLTLNEHRDTSYVEADAVREEIVRARRLFDRLGWPVIDVSRRSVEETAAAVINLLAVRRASSLTPKTTAGVPEATG